MGSGLFQWAAEAMLCLGGSFDIFAGLHGKNVKPKAIPGQAVSVLGG
jgi:hypothetical protein